MKNSTKALTLFAITWPIFLEMLLFMLMGNMDIFMLSQYSDDAVAGMGVGNQFVQMAVVMFGFVSAGAAVIIAQYLGAEKNQEAKKVSGVSLYCIMVFGLVMSAVFIFGRGIILGTMPDLTPQVREYADIALLVIGGGIFLHGFLASINAILRSHGFTRDTLVVTVTMNIINIIGNAIVIFGLFGFPVLGVPGVAAVTVISRTIAALLAYIMLYRRIGNPFRGVKFTAFPFVYVRKILKIGLPAAGENVSYIGYQTFFTMLITTMMPVALTARVYTRALNVFMFLLTVSLAQGGQIIVGHLMGAKEYDQIYKKCFKILRYGIFSSVFFAILFNVFAVQLLGIFTSDPEVIAIGRQVMVVFIFLEIGRACNLVIISSLRAVGDVRFPMVVGILSMWGVGALTGFVLGVVLEMGLVGIVIGTAVDEGTRGIIMFFRWRSRKWQTKGVV